MKINSETRVVGDRVVLVPYRYHHVPKYHEWMSRPEIQELTSSEPLTLPEEYQMQQSWLQDEDKLAFIILSKEMFEEAKTDQGLVDSEVFAMVGDVNCFVLEDTDDEEATEPKFVGELEIMIVERRHRKRGLGIESMRLMMAYCLRHLADRLSSFMVKIDETNIPSINMFEKLGFKRHKYVQAFKQVTLKLDINASLIENVTQACSKFSIEAHEL
jgi:RimJ/RimL family protein N-acetyltransferase